MSDETAGMAQSDGPPNIHKTCELLADSQTLKSASRRIQYNFGSSGSIGGILDICSWWSVIDRSRSTNVLVSSSATTRMKRWSVIIVMSSVKPLD